MFCTTNSPRSDLFQQSFVGFKATTVTEKKSSRALISEELRAVKTQTRSVAVNLTGFSCSIELLVCMSVLCFSFIVTSELVFFLLDLISVYLSTQIKLIEHH